MNEKEQLLRKEIAAEVFHRIPPKEKREAMSDIELAELHASFSSDNSGLIIVQNEWRRREKIEQHKLNQEIISLQHELNLQIVAKQRKVAYISAIFGAAFIIFGAIVGAVLVTYLPSIFPLSALQQEQQHKPIIDKKALTIGETELSTNKTDQQTAVEENNISSQPLVINEKNRQQLASHGLPKLPGNQ
jgi:hypothetical protein